MTQQLLLDILPRPVARLDNFVTGRNAAAVSAVRELAGGRAIYLWGGLGSGRSHLLRACGQMPGGHYIDAATPVQTLEQLASEPEMAPACVAVDDVGQLSHLAQAALFDLFNCWRTLAATPRAFALLTAGDRAPRAMALREDLRTRLGWDLVYRLEQLSDDERAQALRTRAQQRGLPLSEDVLHWMLTHTDRDMGRLTALLDALDHYSLARHRPITLPLLKDLLKGSFTEPELFTGSPPSDTTNQPEPASRMTGTDTEPPPPPPVSNGKPQ